MIDLPGVLKVIEPGDVGCELVVPVVIDSPHSGVVYPPEFDYKAPFQRMQWNVDMYVDELMEKAPEFGAALLYAKFPRCFIDAHRSLDDIDEEMLTDSWPEPITPSVKTKLGRGLLRRDADKDMPIYDRKLTVQEVQARIANYYRPYHATLKQLLDGRHEKFGGVWHINMHSMPPFGRALHEDPGQKRPDMALANKDNGTSSKEFLEFAGDSLTELGYEVWLNKPYKGQVLITAYSDPASNRHSIQIELNRKYYMEWDQTLESTSNFPVFRRDMTLFVEKICSYARVKASC